MMSKLKGKRILIVLSTLEVGGTERQVVRLADHLQHVEQAKVRVWGLGPPGRLTPLLDAHRIRWRFMKRPWSWRGNLRVTLLMRLFAPDVFLTFNHLANIVFAPLWRRSGAKVCVWNQRDEGWRDPLESERKAAAQVPFFLCNSELGASYIENGLGVRRERIRIVRNGVKLDKALRTAQAWRSQLGLSDTDFVACMVANLHEYKDHATVIRAWRHVVDGFENGPPILLLAGRPDLTLPNLQTLVHSLGLEEHVRFLGAVDDVPGLLSAADLAVFASQNEGLPNGVLEPMAAGLPVVATDYPGIEAALGESGRPYLAAQKDGRALAEKILAFARDAELRKSAGEANRLRIAARFAPQEVYGEYAGFIAEWMGEK